MSVELAELVPDVQAEISKVSSLLAKKALSDATIRFFKESLCKNVTLALIPVVADTADYALVNPDGYQIISPRFAEYDKRTMFPTSEDALDLDWGELSAGMQFAWPQARDSGVDRTLNWRYATSERPWLYYCPDPNSIRLVAIPSSVPETGLNVNVYVHPIKNVTEIDDWIYNSWNDVLVLGAIAQLKAMKDKVFYDLRGAAIAEEAFSDKTGELAAAALRGHNRNNRQNLRTKVWR